MDLLRSGLLLMFVVAARAQEPTEFAVKGAYLAKFGDYVEWPAAARPGPGAPFVIGILGEDPFGPQLDQFIHQRTIQGHPVHLRRIREVDQIHQVQVLYVGGLESWRWEALREELRGRSILTVGEPGGRAGAVITFVVVQGKVRFEIDRAAAERAELKLSSKLLALAVKRGAG